MSLRSGCLMMPSMIATLTEAPVAVRKSGMEPQNPLPYDLSERAQPATEMCPYCGDHGGRFGLQWSAERQLALCGACREYGALTFDMQVPPTNKEANSA